MLSQWTTWPNAITACRLVLAAPTAYAILIQSWWLATVLFTLAVVSDFLDGFVARKYDQTSRVGGLLDHLTDATYVTAGCWALSASGLINACLWWLIPAAFIQYVLDSKALSGKALRMSMIGKGNGVAYFVVIGIGVGAQALGLEVLLPALEWFALILVATTLLSMLDRAVALVRTRWSARH